MDEGPDLTIVLLGNTGGGRSASGNTILGRPVFESKQSLASVTKQISSETAEVWGKRITVIDTPGILGSEREIQNLCRDLLQSSRPCLFLVVFRVGPFTKEQTKVLTAAMRVIGPQGLNICHLLFTGGDRLRGTLEDFVFGNEESSPPAAFSRRCHLLDNENGGQEQVRELLMKTGHLGAEQHPELPDRRIVLLGLTGGGRSSSGNTILGSDLFVSAGGFNPVSTQILSQSSMVEGRWVTVVETAGFTSKDLSLKTLYEKMKRSIEGAGPGPHALVIVVRIGTMPAENKKLFELLPQLFNSEVCDAHQYSMVLFTHGDELKDQSIDDLIRLNTHVSDLVSMCGGRYCVFNNKDKRNRQQVSNLLAKVDEMVEANGGEHFTNDMFRMVERFAGTAWKGVLQFLVIYKYKIVFGLLGLILGGTAAVAISEKAGSSIKVGGFVRVLVGGILGFIAGVKVEALVVSKRKNK